MKILIDQMTSLRARLIIMEHNQTNPTPERRSSVSPYLQTRSFADDDRQYP